MAMIDVPKFLRDNFRRMPKWVQVLTYLMILSLFLYLAVLPKYIDGKLIAKIDDAVGVFPVRNAVVEVDVHGRTILLLTDSRGKFSIPFPSKVPFKSYDFMFFPNYFDANAGSTRQDGPAEIPLKVTFTEALSERLHIVYDEKKHSYTIETVLLDVSGIVSTAYAGDDRGKDRKKVGSADFKQEVISALAFAANVPDQQISLDASLREDLQLSAVKLSYVYARLSKKFDIDGFDRAWNSAKKVRDLIYLSSEHYKLIGIDYYKAGQYDKAIEFYEKSLGANLQDERTYNYKGYSLYKKKKYTESLAALKKSNALQPGYFMARLNMVKVYCAMGNVGAAESALLGKPNLSDTDMTKLRNDKEFEGECSDLFKKIAK